MSCFMTATALAALVGNTPAAPDERWLPGNLAYDLDTPFCNIPKVDGSSVSKSEFMERYMGKQPVIFRFPAARNAKITALVQRDAMLKTLGHKRMFLNNRDIDSRERLNTTVREYFEKYLTANASALPSNKAWYWFGQNPEFAADEDWQNLQNSYVGPPFPGKAMQVDFGIGSRGSGAAFHMHGSTFAEMFIGRKRWFLFAIDPRYDHTKSQQHWLNTIYKERWGQLSAFEGCKLGWDCPFECTVGVGEVLYFPEFWYHST